MIEKSNSYKIRKMKNVQRTPTNNLGQGRVNHVSPQGVSLGGTRPDRPSTTSNIFQFQQQVVTQQARLRRLLNQSVDFAPTTQQSSSLFAVNLYRQRVRAPGSTVGSGRFFGGGVVVGGAAPKSGPPGMGALNTISQPPHQSVINADIHLDSDYASANKQRTISNDVGGQRVLKNGGAGNMVSSQGTVTKMQSDEEQVAQREGNVRESSNTFLSMDSQALASKLRVLKQFKPQLPSGGAPRLRVAPALDHQSPQDGWQGCATLSTLNKSAVRRRIFSAKKSDAHKLQPPITDLASRRNFFINKSRKEHFKTIQVSEVTDDVQEVTQDALPQRVSGPNQKSLEEGEVVVKGGGTISMPDPVNLPQKTSKSPWIADLKTRLMNQHKSNSISFGAQSGALRIRENEAIASNVLYPQEKQESAQSSSFTNQKGELKAPKQQEAKKPLALPEDGIVELQEKKELVEQLDERPVPVQVKPGNSPLYKQTYSEEDIKQKDFFLKRSIDAHEAQELASQGHRASLTIDAAHTDQTNTADYSQLQQDYQVAKTAEQSKSVNQSIDECIRKSVAGKSGRTQESQQTENISAFKAGINYDGPKVQIAPDDSNEERMKQQDVDKNKIDGALDGPELHDPLKKQSSTARFTSTHQEEDVQIMYDKMMEEVAEAGATSGNVQEFSREDQYSNPAVFEYDDSSSRARGLAANVYPGGGAHPQYLGNAIYSHQSIEPNLQAPQFHQTPKNQQQPYAININYVQNQFNNFDGNSGTQQKQMINQHHFALDGQNFAQGMLPQYDTMPPGVHPLPPGSDTLDQFYVEDPQMFDGQKLSHFPNLPPQRHSNFQQPIRPVLNKKDRKRNYMSQTLRDNSIGTIASQNESSLADNSRQAATLASNNIAGPQRLCYIRNSQNLLKEQIQIRTPYTMPQPAEGLNLAAKQSQISAKFLNLHKIQDLHRSNIDRLIANYRNKKFKTASQHRYQVFPSKLSNPYNTRVQELLEQPDPENLVDLLQQEIDNQDEPQKYLFKHVVSQRGQNFYYKISKADFIKEQKPKIKVVKVVQPRPKTPPRKFIVPRSKPKCKKKQRPPTPPPPPPPPPKKPPAPKKKMKTKQMQTDFSPRLNERSVCSTERIINIQTLKVRPNILHQSMDLVKDKTRSIIKQASHFITENGEMADYHVANLDEIHQSDGYVRTVPHSKNKSIVVSRSQLPGLGMKPMTAFMDYKDYRIEYENRYKLESSIDSSKDNYHCGNSASNSCYEKNRINKEIRNHDREVARQRGLRYEVANSEWQLQGQSGRREHAPECEDTISPIPSINNLQYEHPAKSNVKIKSFIAAARDTLNNQSREFSKKREASVDYFGQPAFNNMQFSKSFDRVFKKNPKKKQGVYRSQQMVLADDSSRRRSAEPSSRGKSAGGILQQPRAVIIRTHRISERQKLKVQIDEDNEQKKSVTFEHLSPSSPKSVHGLNPLIVKPKVRKLKSEGIRSNSFSLQHQCIESFRSQFQKSSEIDQKNQDDNRTQEGTIALEKNDLWRRHPDLDLIYQELTSITNKNITNPDVTRRLVDWYNTVLYKNIYENGNAEIEADQEDNLFYTSSEALTALHQLMAAQKSQEKAKKNQLEAPIIESEQKGVQEEEGREDGQPDGREKEGVADYDPDIDDTSSEKYKDLLVDCFSRSVNTLRRVLIHEFGLPRIYERYLVLHADDITYLNTTKLLLRCKRLLEGRKQLCQILLIVIEREKLVNSLKQLIALDNAAQEQTEHLEQIERGQKGIIQSSYGLDLGDFEFDEGLAKELGDAIMEYTLTLQSLISTLIGSRTLPALFSTNKTKECVGEVFLFQGMDLIKFVRKQMNEIKHMLFVYRIII